MAYPRVLTVQDISCVGQCSLTVALPILSACGVEAGILPSAVLSTHTAGFSGFTFRDLTDDIPLISAHWQKEQIAFDAIYTGYLGSAKQIAYVKELFTAVAKPSCVRIVDPAMADNGALYPAFDGAYVEEMKKLCACADYVVPNVTEACFLTGVAYRPDCTRELVAELTEKLLALGCKNVILTGVGYGSDRTGVLVASADGAEHYEHEKLARSCHGTGDIFASVFTGALMKGKTAIEASRIAADFVVQCIRVSEPYPEHTYGACFELALPELMKMLQK